MTYTILTPSTPSGRAATRPVPMNGKFYNYSFLKTIPATGVAAIQVAGRSTENVRRAVQIATKGKRHTTVLDNVLMVW